jgi:hypothetical protein
MNHEINYKTICLKSNIHIDYSFLQAKCFKRQISYIQYNVGYTINHLTAVPRDARLWDY